MRPSELDVCSSFPLYKLLKVIKREPRIVASDSVREVGICIYIEVGSFGRGCSLNRVPLAPGEEVHYSDRIRGLRIYVTDRRIVVASSGSLRDVGLRHVTSVEVEANYGVFVAGIALVFMGLFLAALFAPYQFIVFLSFLLVLVGIAIAIYGWLNRYLLRISWIGGSLEIRDGKEKLINLHLKIREQLEKVRIEK